ncbi:MAG: hypothetical protein MAG715_00092 [Methanonatronarchaeales archaeon]|nr:hypothetical protein [Methanonatronarchaeales archaeon]
MRKTLVELGAGRALVLAGLLLIIAGLLWPLIPGVGLGRLPGDVVIEREGFSFYLPVTTMVLLSLAISALLWLVQRWAHA